MPYLRAHYKGKRVGSQISIDVCGGIQVLAGLAPSSQTVGSLFRVIHEQAKQLMNDKSEKIFRVKLWDLPLKVEFLNFQKTFVQRYR
jgi:hypothetical protein